MCQKSPDDVPKPVALKIGNAAPFSRGPARAALAVLLVAGVVGCSAFRMPERKCAPPNLEYRGTATDTTAVTAQYADPAIFEQLTANLVPPEDKDKPPRPGNKRYEILAVSGGGKYGAYPAGVVCGWTCRGTRPKFDVATGVSTGAYVAVFGFLGPKYDAALKRLYTETTTDDILKKYPLRKLPFTRSFASSEPLRKTIEDFTTDETIADLAAAHAEDRHCYIGTTNLDTRRLCVWDVTAIAAGNRPDKKKLLVDIFLATASVPGQFPPVTFDVVVNGQTYTELHVDGGVTSEIFVRLALLNVPEDQLRNSKRPLAGSNIHSLVAGKLYADPDCIKPRVFGSILGTSVGSLVYAMTQNDLLRINYLCLITGMKARFTAVPRDFEDDGDALNFEPKSLAKLFNAGYKVGQTDEGWRVRAPGTEPEEQAVPRAGLGFTVPNLPPPGQYGGPVLSKPKKTADNQ